MHAREVPMYFISSSLPKQADVIYRDINFTDVTFVSAIAKKYELIPRSNPNHGAIDAVRRRFGIKIAEKADISRLKAGDVLIVINISGPHYRMGTKKVYSEEQLKKLNISFRGYLIHTIN